MRFKILTLLLFTCFSSSLFCGGRKLSLQSKFDTDTLFIQQANTATLRSSLAEPGKYELILRGINPKTLYVTTKSKHEAGTITLIEFLRIWEKNAVQFGDSGPSVVLSYLSFKPFVKSGVETDTLELSNPIYDSSSNTISFQATPEHTNTIKTGRFKNVVILYDGLSASSKDLNAQYKTMPSPELKNLEPRI